jgi:hypothetical protein
MEVPSSFETSVLTRATRHDIPENAILHSRRLEYLKSYNVVPSSSIFVTVMTEALSSFEMSVLTRATRRNIPEDGILKLVACLTIVRICRVLWPYWSDLVSLTVGYVVRTGCSNSKWCVCRSRPTKCVVA